MKKNTKIAFGGIMAALCVVMMLFSYFPYFTYAAPGVASLFIMIALIETDKKWAFLVYMSSALIVFLFAENESRFIYALFFGHYPILKALFEGRLRGIALWIIKFLSFNVCVGGIYLLLSATTGISLSEFNELGRFGLIIFLLIANAAFVIYDIALSRMATFYFIRFHNTVKKMLKF